MPFSQQGRHSIRILIGGAGDFVAELQQAIPPQEKVILAEANSRQQLLAMAEAAVPDLIVLDLNLLGAEATGSGHSIKAHPAVQTIPLVLALPQDRPTYLAEVEDVDCDAVMVRPIDRQRLWQTLGQLLNITNRMMPRANARLRIHFGIGTQRLLTDYSVNLSAGGVFIETFEPFEAETPLTLEFSLPGNPQVIHCRGRVAWVNHADQPASPSLPPGIGVLFLDLSLADLRALRTFLAKSVLEGSW
jgi:uncharacterized protein (TIGR02266 family)